MAGYSDIGTAAAGMFGGSIEKATLYVLNPSYDSIKDDEIGTAANELIAAIRDGKGSLDNGKGPEYHR